MIFPKQFLQEALDNKTKKALYQIHPFETHFKEGDKSPAELVLMNYGTFFDLKSNELKQLASNARKEIASNCFNQEVMDIFPNQNQIEECIKRVNYKHLGNHYDRRNVYFGNINYNYELKINEIPHSVAGERRIFEMTDAVERLMWDAFKSKHYFSEKFMA